MLHMLEISTRHLTPETIEKLEEDSIDEVAVYRKGDHGFFLCSFYVDEHNNLPADLVDVLEYAAGRDAEWIMLEPDAETVNGLPVYKW